MKKIGFLSFGHWSETPYSQVRTAEDALLQSIHLAVAAEALGADGAYFRVHHFARQLASPFPLLAATGARTSRIEIGTAVIDMRYENPLYMAEDAGAADIIAVGGSSWGSAAGHRSRSSTGSATSGTPPPKARRTPTWRDGMPRSSSTSCAARALPRRPAAECPQPARASPPRAVRGRSARAHLVRRRDRCTTAPCRRPTRNEPAELDPQVRRVGRAPRHPAAQQIEAYRRGVEEPPDTSANHASR